MIACSNCPAVIDSDDDPACFTGPEGDGPVLCEPCRDKAEADLVAYHRAGYDAASPEERNPEKYRQDLIDAGRGHLVGGGESLLDYADMLRKRAKEEGR